MTNARYAIGVDLGTTHCALSFVDLLKSEGEEVKQEFFPIAQVIIPGEVDNRWLLPSFLYLPHPQELKPGAAALPWNPTPAYIVGEIARNLGARTPIRLVSSAKSWLCHSGVDRRGAILPTDAPEEVSRLSPFSASVQYLAHLRDAWNHAHPNAPFSEQEIILTVPASFDPAARELTAEAAKAAGYDQLTLLEEPQAALYSWIEQTHGSWRDHVHVGDVLLVVDIGGGTTDFSLIAVHEKEGTLQLERIAVGDHILLGGDNMDLALAYTIKAKLEASGKSLDDWQLRALTHGCRNAKETLLNGEAQTVPIVVPSRTSKLIGGSLRTELTLEEVRAVLIDGFFPLVNVDEQPKTRARAALTSLGLPYAQDAAMTRHLAAFLTRQTGAISEIAETRPDARFLHPTAILFNGGVLKSSEIAQRIVTVVQSWLEADGASPARIVDGADLDRSVSRGAAYYGYVRHGGGIRIRGGMAQTFYVGMESAAPAIPGIEPPVHALCVAPFGLEEGMLAPAPKQELGLVVGEKVRFRFFGSSVRREDQPGDILPHWNEDEVIELGQIEATLSVENASPGDIVPVRLRSRISELGTLVLEALPREGAHVWKVEFNIREE